MITYSIILFSIAAIGGLVMAVKILGGRQAPWPLSVIHGLLGAAGLVLLGLATWQSQGEGRLTMALALLVVAALGGFYLASLHLRGDVAQKGVVVIHAGVAVSGVLVLLSVLLGI